MDRLMCMACEPDEITDEGMCEMCTIAGEVPDADRLGCSPCPLTQIAMDGQCQNCNVGEIPSADRISCTACSPSAFVQASTTCQDCPSGEVPTADRLSCVACNSDEITNNGVCVACSTNGEVPNSDKTSCIACPLSQIEVSGQCQNCPVGQAPEDDRISCYVEIDCPDDCTSPDQGDCDKRTGLCICKNGYTCLNCAGTLLVNILFIHITFLILLSF